MRLTNKSAPLPSFRTTNQERVVEDEQDQHGRPEAFARSNVVRQALFVVGLARLK